MRNTLQGQLVSLLSRCLLLCRNRHFDLRTSIFFRFHMPWKDFSLSSFMLIDGGSLILSLLSCAMSGIALFSSFYLLATFTFFGNFVFLSSCPINGVLLPLALDFCESSFRQRNRNYFFSFTFLNTPSNFVPRSRSLTRIIEFLAEIFFLRILFGGLHLKYTFRSYLISLY